MFELDIVFRSCDKGSVHSDRGPRFIDVPKKELVMKCFISLLESITLVKDCSIRLWVIDDNSSEDLLSYLKIKIKEYNIEGEVLSCSGEGFNASAFDQFHLCIEKGREWVYSVEDDYLHTPQAIQVMIDAAKTFSKLLNSPVAIRPDDDVFSYSFNSEHSHLPCKIFNEVGRHWRTLKSSHNTFFTHKTVLIEYWSIFATLARFFKKLSINEDNTINLIWSNGFCEGKIPLLSPIPTLAVHISQNNEPIYFDYKQLWESIKV